MTGKWLKCRNRKNCGEQTSDLGNKNRKFEKIKMDFLRVF